MRRPGAAPGCGARVRSMAGGLLEWQGFQPERARADVREDVMVLGRAPCPLMPGPPGMSTHQRAGLADLVQRGGTAFDRAADRTQHALGDLNVLQRPVVAMPERAD